MKHSAVTILSTGAMGTAFCKVFLSHGLPVTVWNRTASRAEPLVELGAAVAATVEEAVAASRLIIALPHPYEVLQAYLINDAVADVLRGKDLIIMSSCRDLEQPRAMLDWAEAHAIHLVDGKIFAYPGEIGKGTAPLAYCGSRDAFTRAQSVLSTLGRTNYLGESITNAFILEAASVSWNLSAVGAFLNGLALCRAAGFPLEIYAQTCLDMLPGMRDYLERVVQHIVPARDFDPAHHDTASIAGLAFVLEHFADVFSEYQIEPRQVELIAPLMRQQIEAGGGGLDMASLTDLFSKHNP